MLLISIDSARRDVFGFHGRRPKHAPELSPSPNLDALAAESVVFENASATSSWTLPAHMSMLTGEPELVHGVEDDGLALGPDTPLLAERLAEAGYRTTGFYSGPYLDPRHGFDRGFERYEACYGRALSEAREALADAEERFAAGTHNAEASRNAWARAQRSLERASQQDVSSERIADAAIAELEAWKQDERPGFLLLHFFDPHYDYVPPPAHDRFDPGYAGTVDGRDPLGKPGLGERGPDGKRDLEHLLALYEGEIAATDAALGRVLATLADLELDDSTLVVVVADHGDEFLEHGQLGHRKTLYEEVLAVPLVVRPPGGSDARRRTEIVSLLDVHATILESCGLASVAGTLSRNLLHEPLEPQGALGRLVRRTTRDRKDSGAQAPVPLHHLELHESFRIDGIKIMRVHRTYGKHEDYVDEQSLWWSDLEQSPDEPDVAKQAEFDFDDPRAAAALQAFRSLHARLRARRRAAIRAPLDRQLDTALRALGYTGGVRESEALEVLTAPVPEPLTPEQRRENFKHKNGSD